MNAGAAGPWIDMAETRALPLKRLTLPSGAGVALWLAGPASPGGVPDHLWKGLSAGEKDRANRFLRVEDLALFALTRGTLRCLLSEATGVAADKIAFAEGPYGKPCVVGTHGPHFNVSHSGCWALIGFSDTRDIGVDIELMRAAGGELDLARSFFSAAEYRSLEGLANGKLLSSFYKNLDLQGSGSEGAWHRNLRASEGFFSRIDHGWIRNPSRTRLLFALACLSRRPTGRGPGGLCGMLCLGVSHVL